MYLKISELRLERKEILRERERINTITNALAHSNSITQRTKKLEKDRDASIDKIEWLERHSRTLWSEIEATLKEHDICTYDILAFRLRCFELCDWNFIECSCKDSTENIRKRIERISKAIIMIPDDKGVI